MLTKLSLMIGTEIWYFPPGRTGGGGGVLGYSGFQVTWMISKDFFGF